MAELGVTVLHAHSPQAKGRVERLFRTFQDRVIKELRLADIRTIAAANTFLATYLPRYNERFRVVPAAGGRRTPALSQLDALGAGVVSEDLADRPAGWDGGVCAPVVPTG